MRRLSVALLLISLLHAPAFAQFEMENVALFCYTDARECPEFSYRAVDGEYGQDNMWNAFRHAVPGEPLMPYLYLDLGREYDIYLIRVIGCDSIEYDMTYYETYDLSAGVKDGLFGTVENWNFIGGGVLYDHPELRLNEFAFNEPLRAQCLKVDFTGGNHWAHMNEIEAYGVPVTPEPLAGILFLLGGCVLGIQRRMRKEA